MCEFNYMNDDQNYNGLFYDSLFTPSPICENCSISYDDFFKPSDDFDQINEYENMVDELNKKEKSPNNSEENFSKKKTSASNENPNKSSVSNISQNENPKILDNTENSENSNELKQKNIQEICLKNHEFISYEEIINKYGINLKFDKLKSNLAGKIINTKNIEKKLDQNEKKKLLGNKRKNDTKIEEKEEKIEKKEKKKGRKKEGDKSGEHTKMKEDNLIYKIKSNFNNWLLNLVNKYLPESQKLVKINFQDFSKVINTNENIRFLKMELSEIFSKNISKVYSKKIQEKDGINLNKNIIEEIMKSDNEKAKTLLKLTYKDALDLYRFKENENLKKILDDKDINEKRRFDEFLFNTFEKEIKKIGEEKAYDFVSSLMVMVYNYERWFLLKFPRKKRENKNKVEN